VLGFTPTLGQSRVATPFAKDLLWFKNDTKEEFLNDINNFWVDKDLICIRSERK
jgi:hypothetical protein